MALERAKDPDCRDYLLATSIPTQRTLRTRTRASENAQEEIVDQAIKPNPRPPKKQKVVTQTSPPTPTLTSDATSTLRILCLLVSLRTPLRGLLDDSTRKLPEQQKNKALIADAQTALTELEGMIDELIKN